MKKLRGITKRRFAAAQALINSINAETGGKALWWAHSGSCEEMTVRTVSDLMDTVSGHCQYFMPGVGYIAAYVGIYNDSGQPVNGTGVGYACKGSTDARGLALAGLLEKLEQAFGPQL